MPLPAPCPKIPVRVRALAPTPEICEVPQKQPLGAHNSSTEQEHNGTGRPRSLTGSVTEKDRPRGENDARCRGEQDEKQLDTRPTSWENMKGKLKGSRAIPP